MGGGSLGEPGSLRDQIVVELETGQHVVDLGVAQAGQVGIVVGWGDLEQVRVELGKLEAGEGIHPVGVGIATGETFVGNIQAADRLIWTAIGNATNLAARLQGLTRTLEAGMVIDAATWTLAGDAQPLFRRSEETAVRGRSDLQDVYVRPLAQAAPDPPDGVAR